MRACDKPNRLGIRQWVSDKHFLAGQGSLKQPVVAIPPASVLGRLALTRPMAAIMTVGEEKPILD